MKRRDLLKSMLAGGAISSLARDAQAADKKKWNVLFMGGTGFIGPHMVAALQAEGHTVTLFNRGKTNPGLFTDLEKINGDRLSDNIKQVSNKKWDLIVDTSCYVPRGVTTLMDAVDKSSLKQ